MWRRNAAGFRDEAREIEDSDQSISEDDEGVDGEWMLNTVSLGGGEKEKGKKQLLSQLELFRESSKEDSISFHGNKGGSQIEDEVEPPIFNAWSSPNHYHGIASAALAHSNEGLIYLQDMASISYSEDIISDEEKVNPHTFRSVGENLAITWSEANREVEALVRSNEKPCCSLNHHDVFVKEKKSNRGEGGKRKAKAKFSFPYHSDKTDLSLVVSDSNGETSSDNIHVADVIGAVADDEMQDNMADSQLNIHAKRLLPFEMAHKNEARGHSMAEIISGFLEKSDPQEGSSKLEIQKRRRRRKQTVLVRNVPPLDDSIRDNDPPEALDSDTSFEGEDEENAQSAKSIICRTMADQFHEAFRTVSAIDDIAFPRPLCGGIYRKLQQVMQIEKEREVDSLKNVSVGTGPKDEGSSILVRILSKSLEAKLIVCSCTCIGDGKLPLLGYFPDLGSHTPSWRTLISSHNIKTSQENLSREMRTMTIIFKPRISNDSDLEVGNLIRLRPPWKEVQVKDEVIFLCSYFFQVRS